ncbi:unnamed protein product, partial [marine sediment metagenome]
AEIFTKLLSPFAPHLAEELWQIFGNKPSIADEEFPVYNEEFFKEDIFEYPVSFNGKLRFKIELSLSLEKEEIEAAVLNDKRTDRWLDGKKPKKIIIVHKRIVNVVV